MTKLSATVLAICLAIASCGDSKPNDLLFDSATWKKGEPRVRFQMVADLIERKMLIGKTRNEIMEILGSGIPSQRTYIQYEINNGSPLNLLLVSRVYLTVVFDEDGQYVKEVIVVDA